MIQWQRMQGFTLVELLVCLMIIALLVGIFAVPTYQRVLDLATLRVLQTTTEQLEQSRSLVMLDNLIHEYRWRGGGIYFYRYQGSIGPAEQLIPWPTGVTMDPSYSGQNTNVLFYPDGRMVIVGPSCLHFLLRGKGKLTCTISQQGIVWAR